MPSRVRTQEITYVPVGTLSYPSGSVISDNPQRIKLAKCEDATGYPGDHPLKITKYDLKALQPLNGVIEVVGGPPHYEFTNFRPIGAGFTPTHVSLSVPTSTSAATTAMARTNPGRSEVSIPVFIRELKDLPGMLKNIGDLLKKSKRKKPIVKLASGEYLSWNFGWLPLVSDLRKMLNFQALVAKRQQELDRLHSKGGLKRRFTTFSSSGHAVDNVYIHSLGKLLSARKTTDTKVTQWATLRWLPTKLPKSPVVDRGKQARDAVFGLSLQPEDLWEVIPWSWLIDWFSNVGDFIQAHNNRIPASCSVVNIMTKRESTIVLNRTNHLQVTGCEGSVTLVTKERSQSSGGLSIGEGFLGPHQLSILGALAINRLSKRF